jgi:hypothetical protein
MRGTLNGFGQSHALFFKDALRQLLRVHPAINQAATLKNDRALIKLFVGPMRGATAFSFSSGNDSVVHMLAPHSVATVFWKQRRMDIDAAIFPMLHSQ